MLRFASSPTGDMSISDLRIALFSHLIAQEKKEDLIIRIEDMDKKKNIDGKDQEILGILGLFGITHTQVIYQSESVRFHSAMALQLVHEKKAFSCFCSDTWIEKKHQEAKEAGIEYKYDDACRNLPAELVIDNTSPFCIRIVKAEDGESFVILNQDKIPTHNFSTAVDDMLNDISIVICTQDLKNDTLFQEHIRDSLEYDKRIEYRYIPQLEGSVSVKSLLEQGFLPEAISNYLISLNAKNSPIRFNIDALRCINKEHLKALDSKELSRYVGFADAEIGELARIYLDEVATTKELKEKITPIFSERNIPATFSKQATVMKEIIKDAPYFDSYDAFKNYVSKESKLQGEEFSTTLRLLLTNAQDGPDIAQIYKYLKNYIGEIIK